MRIPQRAFAGGILSAGMYARTDIGKWQHGLKDAVNIILRAEGGANNRAGTRLAGGYDTSTVDGNQHLIPFEATADDTYVIEFTEQLMRVIKNGAYVLDSSIAAGAVVAMSAADPCVIEMTSSVVAATFSVGQLVYFEDPNGTFSIHQCVLKITGITNEFISFTVIGDDTIDNTGNVFGTLGASATLSAIYEVATPYAIEDVKFVQFTQDVDTMFFAHVDYQPRKLLRTADDNWTWSILTFAPEISAPTGQAAVIGSGSGSDTYNYKVSAINPETGEESLPSGVASVGSQDLTLAGAFNTITWSAVTDAGLYRIYKEFNGLFGYIGQTDGLTFDDQNITPNTVNLPQTGRNPFDTSDDYPATAAFIEQRLAFAATVNNPQAVEMSASTSPLNFNRSLSPTGSDAISFRMRSQQLNRVYHIIEADRPLILTAGAEWYVDTAENAPMTVGNFSLRPKTYRGSAQIPEPVIVGDNILHVTRDGNTIREFSLSDSRDTASADLTVLARSLFKGKTIVSMAYAQAPDSVVWVVLSSGECYSLTYLQEHEVWGWTRHEFAGTDVLVKQVVTITEGAYDIPYFVVSRTLYGKTVTTTERLDNREFLNVSNAYFVDCGFQFSSLTPASTLRGYIHLRGEEVAVLADGSVLDGIVVTAQGTVDLFEPVTVAAVGLGYDSYMVTLEGDMGDQIKQLGASMGRFMSAHEVAIKVVDTRGIAVGLEGRFLNEVKEFSGDDPIPLATTTHVMVIEGDWERDQSIEVRQVHPLPMTITAIGPSWELGE